jgi:hypothetical protein
MTTMATITFKSARVRAEFTTDDAHPMARSFELPVNSIKTTNAQPDNALRKEIALGIKRTSGQFMMYCHSDRLTPLANAVPRGVRLEIRLRVDNEAVTDVAFFPIPANNALATTDGSFVNAQLMFYVVKGSRTLFVVVSPPGPGDGDPKAGCDAPAGDAERFRCALVGAY